ncbi:MAG: MBL fold metallo-hydrolase [Candidatus Dormibacteria bacterium]
MTGEPATILRVTAPNPGPLTGRGTNTWIFGDGQAAVIDPGPDDQAHLERVLAAASTVGPVVLVLCTHHHQDHLEGARRLCRMTSAPLAAHFRLAGGGADLPLHDRDRLLAGRAELLALATPGHSQDHVCFYDESSGVLFTGDHVLQGSSSVIDPPDGDMSQYLASLELVRALGPSRLLPGHGEPLAPAGPAISQVIQHRLEREGQILGLLRSGPATAAALVPTIYRDYPEEVLGLAQRTVLAHLIKLEQEGRVGRLAADPGEAPRFFLGQGGLQPASDHLPGEVGEGPGHNP